MALSRSAAICGNGQDTGARQHCNRLRSRSWKARDEPGGREHESAETSMAITTSDSSQIGMRNNLSTFEHVRKLRFGATVQASDGEAGTLVALVVDGQRRTVIEIGVRRGPFRPCAFVALEHVTVATSEALTVDITRADLERQHIPAGMALTAFTTVRADGAYLGRLAQMTVTAPSETIRHFVVANGVHGLHNEASAPARIILGISARRISVRLDGMPHKRLLPYRSDTLLRQDVYSRLFEYAPLRVDLPGITIHPIDGVVWLHGYVSSSGARRMAEDRARGAKGLTALHNELTSDDALAAAISMALAHDPGVDKRQQIGVYPRLGVVYLRGSVRTLAARERAGAVALASSIARQVVNELRITPSIEALSVMANVTNQPDLVPDGS